MFWYNEFNETIILGEKRRMENTNFDVAEVAIAFYRNYGQGYTLEKRNRSMSGLTLILSGSLEMHIGERTLTATPGSILLQRAGDSYRLEAPTSEGVEYIVISYRAEPQETLDSLLPDRLFFSEHPHRYRSSFEYAARVYASMGVCCQPLLRALVQEILCNIIRENYPILLSRERNPVAYAKRYIEEYYGGDLSAENIAAVVGLSPSYLRALFKQTVGESPIRYLNRVRIERAREMIASGMFHLDEVAEACGFQNVYYFSRVFKSFTGVPPGKY